MDKFLLYSFHWGIQKVVVGRNNGVVGLTRFQNKEMTGLSFGTQKIGCNNMVVIWQVSLHRRTFCSS